MFRKFEMPDGTVLYLDFSKLSLVYYDVDKEDSFAHVGPSENLKLNLSKDELNCLMREINEERRDEND
jgi:hypothetical protein